MKLLIFLVLLFLFVPVFSQDYEDYNAGDLFGNSQATFIPSTMTQDSTYVDATTSLMMVHTVADTNSTITSAPISHLGTNDMTISAQVDSVDYDTLKTYFYFGYYTSPSYDWTWVLMDSLESDGATFKWNVGEQAWGPYEAFSNWGIRIAEQDDSTRANYSVDVLNLSF